ncbi:histidine kinase dimerization/phosphoacceptor domain -containing protein [Sphingomonas sp.]|uniref:sensor histidine kinase n=1 Tax=Sphingomonas sp. TaxID=28214 RepID=UPI00286E3232|nr:histidine kinase dimerization/phosphoacceptor domain -containing protein [Sphingomonas sp.]
MNLTTPLPAARETTLAAALIESAPAPLLLLDHQLAVVAASSSFCATFDLDPATTVGRPILALGQGEWNVPQLKSLLVATLAGKAAIPAYEMDLVRPGVTPCRVVVGAHKLDFADSGNVRLAVTITDVSADRAAARIKDDLIRDKEILLKELQHRIANSLQIIASVLMQSARRVQSEETRVHLHDAHHRVMSIATLQKQLAVSGDAKVALRKYFTDLCDSIGASMIADHDRLTLTASVDDTCVSPQCSVSLGLIVTELVINALKHAFPGRNRSGKITVTYAATDSGWALTVSDDGVGMAGGKESKPGLGTGIVEALSAQLDATVTVTDGQPGTIVAIVKT